MSPSARIGKGSIIEPMAVIHTGCVISTGCIVSAGAVVNHESVLCEGVHVECNATVVGNATVPKETKICSGEFYKGIKTVSHGPIPYDGKEYCFEDGM